MMLNVKYLENMRLLFFALAHGGFQTTFTDLALV